VLSSISAFQGHREAGDHYVLAMSTLGIVPRAFKMSEKLGNPRLLRIHFHTLRHWKATMEYHRTKDILCVMKLLGHKNIANTLIYTQLVEFEGDEYHSAIANNVEEAQKLIEAGFEYVCSHRDEILFRKRK
jgi:integrase